MEHLDVHGARVPKLGFGTFELEGEDCRRGVEVALGLGYRHIDTAQLYGNEDLVGEAVAASGVDRDDVFLVTKVWNDKHEPDDVRASTEESLRKLRVDHVDLLLVHWPVRLDILEQTLDAMHELREQGKTRHVGVSNFTPSQVERAAKVGPVLTNQVEYHPLLSQDRLIDQARSLGYFLTAYSPLARGLVLREPVLQEIGAAHGKSPAQVVLRWLLDQDVVAAIPKATRPEHIQANFEVFDFSLSAEERDRITALDREERTGTAEDLGITDWER